jgi:hypothetical protein
LLVAPVVELARHDRIHICADLGIAQQLYGIAGGREDAFQVLRAHVFFLRTCVDPMFGIGRRRVSPVREPAMA